MATMIISASAVAFFAFIILALWAGYSEIEAKRRATEKAVEPHVHDEAKCLLCNRPLPRSFTSDEVVSELERRIDADTALVTSALSQPPAEGVLARIYQA